MRRQTSLETKKYDKEEEIIEPESDARSLLSITRVAVLSSVFCLWGDEGRERNTRVNIKDGSDSQCLNLCRILFIV